MKLPAVAIAAAFIGGIVLGLCPLFANHAISQAFLVRGFAASIFRGGAIAFRVHRCGL